MEQNRELFRALKEEQVVTFIIIALIVIVAALNILIALTMMVMEKTRDIAVMMSFGVEPARSAASSSCKAFLISIIGTAIGLALGYAGAWAGGHYHFIHLSASVYSIDTLSLRPAPHRRRHRRRRLQSASRCWPRSTPPPAAARVLPAEALIARSGPEFTLRSESAEKSLETSSPVRRLLLPLPSPTLRPAAVASLATMCSPRTSSLRPARTVGIDRLR
jgi:hypothetical protein